MVERGAHHNKAVCIVASHLVSPATLDEHQADTFGEHVFVNVLSP
jgi:hypothetical protein